ncbi:MAG TPA: AIR synthase related protein [Spirochaetia bacterium]|nr:AIR synthase related protein [Spirochaetia bacterium]
MGRPLGVGKLPPDLLARLLRYTSRSPSITIGAGPGEDAAVVSGSPTIVLTTDPITFTGERLGTYAVAVNANDIVAMGGRPVYLTTTVLLSPGATEDDAERTFSEIADACRKYGLLWVGGHTEVTPVVSRTVICGQAVGFLSGSPLSTAGARPGDEVCMTKWAGLEGSTTIARERRAECRETLGDDGLRRVLEWLGEPGISIIAEGRALEGLALTSGHDPTEGGIAMGIHEICQASRVGVVIREEAIPVKEETRRLCARFGMDPLGLLSSGVFLFTAPRDVAAEACRRARERGIPAEVIGTIQEQVIGELLEKNGRRIPLVASHQDEIVKLQQ